MSVKETHMSTRKTIRQNSDQFQMNVLSHNHQQQQQDMKPEIQDDLNPSFFHEISNIMRGSGDCDRPLTESVLLIEKIVQQQLKGILNDAIETAIRRKGSSNPTQSEFEFLMRKHPVRISRMRKHIKDVNLLQKILKLQQNFSNRALQQQNTDIDSNHNSDDDIEGDILNRYDEEKTRRLFRADRISQTLSGVQYQRFHEARRVSFYYRHSDKMKQKLRKFLDLPTDVHLTNSCYHILAYLMHETVAIIIDYSILTRLNSDNRQIDPFNSATSSGSSYNMQHLCPEVTQGRGLESIKPITVKEIHEAMRRFNQLTKRGIGFYRNTVDADMRKCYLAI